MTGFFRGIKHQTNNNVPRSVELLSSTVRAFVGTAPQSDAEQLPLDEPVLFNNAVEAAKVGLLASSNGTLGRSLSASLDQAQGQVVVVRVAEGADIPETVSNIIGGIDQDTGEGRGLSALLSARAKLGVQPRIVCVPEYTSYLVRNSEGAVSSSPVISAALPILERLRAFMYADGPNTTDDEAVQLRNTLGSKRVMLVDPLGLRYDTEQDTLLPLSGAAYYTGVRARVDTELGLPNSVSNKLIYGIDGTVRPIDFDPNDPATRANHLNANDISTIVNYQGWRTGGNRTCSSDQLWSYEAHVRLHDIVLDSLVQAHLYALDQVVSGRYVDAVLATVNAYLRGITAQGLISGGRCWLPADRNTAQDFEQGKVFFALEYGRYGIAENITFEAAINNDYTVEQIFG